MSLKRYISPIREKAPRKLIFTKFCIWEYAGPNRLCKFWFGKIKRFGRGQILESPVEMAGHSYNSRAACDRPTCM